MMNWFPRRDDYGRSAHDLIADGKAVGSVVKLPKVYVEKYGHTHLSNDWTIRGEGAVAYHYSLKAAKARIEGIALAVAKGSRPAGLALYSGSPVA